MTNIDTNKFYDLWSTRLLLISINSCFLRSGRLTSVFEQEVGSWFSGVGQSKVYLHLARLRHVHHLLPVLAPAQGHPAGPSRLPDPGVDVADPGLFWWQWPVTSLSLLPQAEIPQGERDLLTLETPDVPWAALRAHPSHFRYGVWQVSARRCHLNSALAVTGGHASCHHCNTRQYTLGLKHCNNNICKGGLTCIMTNHHSANLLCKSSLIQSCESRLNT